MASARKLLIATSNAGKRRELEPAFAALGWECIGPDALGIDSPEETGATFLENALLKARHGAGRCDTWVLAEDSGLCVPALDGAPGVYSARFAGDGASDAENLTLLLQRLEGLAPSQRQAYFVCVMILLRGPRDPDPLVTRGVWRGTIAQQARGVGGFGYDPIFLPQGREGSSAAEMSLEEKLQESHRGRALRQLLAEMQQESIQSLLSSSHPPSTRS